MVFGLTFSVFAVYSLLVIILSFDAGILHVNVGTAEAEYISPFYGPNFGIALPLWLPYAVITLWAPFGFRGTCYYMRRIYYRSIFQSPPGCTVSGVEARKGKYSGESRLPFWVNNFHRYFLYAAILLGIFHWYEAVNTLILSNGGFYFGVGSIFAFADAIFLTLYIVSCHAFRHLFGGYADRQGTFVNKIWYFISKLNERHGLWFWLSLFSIWAYDLYIRLVSWNILTEVRLL